MNTRRPTMEERLNLELALEMQADELAHVVPRRVAVWRALILLADTPAGECKGRDIANGMLEAMALELAVTGHFSKCQLPEAIADFAQFVAMEWPATVSHRAGGRHG